MRRHKGLFITFEGGEGAGKSTLLEGVARRLRDRGLEVLSTREPGGTPLGEEIRALLLRERAGVPISPMAELFLFLAARAEHVDVVITPALARGAVVLCDRFSDSTIAYQGAGRGLGMEHVSELCERACHGMQPDRTFFIDLAPSLGLKRAHGRNGNHDRMESQALTFHETIRTAFCELAKRFPSRIVMIDGTRTPEVLCEEVFTDILSHVL